MGENDIKKAIAVLVVVIVILSVFSATIILLKYNEFKAEIEDVEKAEFEYYGTGIEYISKEFHFSYPEITEPSKYVSVKVAESDLYSIGDGKPVLPVNLTVFELPFGSEILEFSYEYTEPEEIKIPDMLSFGSYNPATEEDTNIYVNTSWYPSEWVTYHTGGGLTDDGYKTFFVLRINPVKYLPLRNRINFVEDFRVNIVYREPDEPVLEDKDDCDLLIIAPSIFKKNLLPLVNHKNDKDVETELVTVEEIYKKSGPGRDDAEKIKYYIKEKIEEDGIKYVLLVGGIKGQTSKWNVPARYSHVVPPTEQEYAEESFLSDLYFADIYDSEGKFSSWDSNGNGVFAEWNEDEKDEMDLYPDVYVGRLACRNRLEVKTIVDKIINYEKEDITDEDWFKKLVLVAGDSYVDDNHLNEGELITEEAIEHMPGFDPVKVYASEMQITPKTINSAINSGCGFLYFCGHGSVSMWGTHYPPEGETWTKFYNNYNINALKNKNKYPIAVIGGCLNGKFDVSISNNIKQGIKQNGFIKYFLLKFWKSGWTNRCWAWKLTIDKNGGAIATISNTGLGTHGRDDTDYNDVADYIEVLNGWMEIKFLDLYGEEHKDILGENHGQTITEYLHRFLGNNDKMDVKMAQQWALFGDPSLKIGGYE